LTVSPAAAHYPVQDLRNGHPMFPTLDHSLSSPGFLALACACVVVANKSKKQSLI
jgi:hypothetical protein